MSAVPFDPQLAAALPTINEHVPPGFGASDIARMRAVTAARTASDEDLTRGGAVEVRAIPAAEAGVELLLCRPVDAPTPAPLLYYLHGGGMIMGTHRAVALLEVLDWAQALGAVVVSAEYRLAPEHPDPAPVEDCFSGLAAGSTTGAVPMHFAGTSGSGLVRGL